MSKWEKIFIGLLIVCIAGLLLFYFGKKERKDPPKKYDGIELTYYKVFDDTDVFEPMITDFVSTHPGLKINYKKFADFSEYQATVINEMAEGEGPDIFSMQNTWFKSNYKKIAPFPESLGGVADFDATFVDVASKDLIRPDENGVNRIYGLPMTVDTLALYYNNDHFEDKLPEKGRPSSTWEGIKEDVIALNKGDNSFDRFEVSGIAMGRSDNIGRAIDILYLLFLQHGVNFYNETISKAIFAGQQNAILAFPGVKALELFTSFADPSQKYYSWNEFVVEDDDEGQEIEAFAEGKVSMIIGYSFTYDYILDSIKKLSSDGKNSIDKDAVRVAPIPQLYDPSVSTEKRVAYANYFAETVSRNSDHPDLAWEFLLFLTDKSNLEKYFELTNKPSSRRDMIDVQKKDPVYGVFASQSGYAESFPVLDYYAYSDAFSKAINSVNSDSPSKSSLVTAQTSINELLPPEGVLPELKAKDKDNEKVDK